MGENRGPNEITSLSDPELRTTIAKLIVACNVDWRKLEELIPYLEAAEKRGTISLALTAEEARRRLDRFKQNKNP